MAGLISAALVGCGGKSESDKLTEARAAVSAGKSSDAVLQLKAILQANEQSAEARYLLGQSLFKLADQGAAAVEFQKAFDLGYPRNQVVPALAEAMLASGQGKRMLELHANTQLDDPKAMASLKASIAGARLLYGETEAGRAAIAEAQKLDPSNFTAGLLNVRMLAGAGQLDGSLSELDRLAGLYPQRAEVLVLRGDLLWQGKNELDAAVAALRKALTLDPVSMPAFTSLLSIHLQRRDTKALADDLAQMEKRYPVHAQTRFFQANKALIDGDLRRAREMTQLMLQVVPDNPYVLQLAGAVEFEAGVLVAAESRLTKALASMPGLPTARRLLAETHMRNGQPAKALLVLQPMLGATPPDVDALSLAAQAYLQSGDPGRAEQLFLLASKSSPGNPKVQTALALTQIAQGRVDLGFSQLQQAAATQDANFADLALYSARLQRKELPAALAAAEGLQRKMPNKPLPYMLQAQVLQAQGDRVRARDRYEQALKADPAHVPAVKALAALDVAEGKREAALKRSEELRSRDPDNPDVVLAVAELRLATGQNAEGVAELLAEAVRKNPKEAPLRVAQVELLLAQRKPEAALSVAQNALSAMPDVPQIIDALGTAQMATGAAEQAISSFRKVAAALPAEIRPLLRLADAYIATDKPKLAEQHLRKALEIQPRSLAAQRGLIQVALMERRTADALKVAQAVQQQLPTEPIGHMLEGEIHASKRAWDASLAAYRTALQRKPVAEVAKWVYLINVRADRLQDAEAFSDKWLAEHPSDAEFLLFVANQALERKQWPLAEDRLRALMKAAPDSPTAPNNLAWVLVQQGKPGAVDFARRASELLPDNAAVLDTLGLALAAEKRWKEAVQTQQRAADLAPSLGDFRLRLAKYQIEAGDKTAARENLSKLEALGEAYSGFPEVRKLLKTL